MMGRTMSRSRHPSGQWAQQACGTLAPMLDRHGGGAVYSAVANKQSRSPVFLLGRAHRRAVLDIENPHPAAAPRRGLLKCMAGAGTGIVWTVAGGVPRGLSIGEALA